MLLYALILIHSDVYRVALDINHLLNIFKKLSHKSISSYLIKLIK